MNSFEKIATVTALTLGGAVGVSVHEVSALEAPAASVAYYNGDNTQPKHDDGCEKDSLKSDFAFTFNESDNSGDNDGHGDKHDDGDDQGDKDKKNKDDNHEDGDENCAPAPDKPVVVVSEPKQPAASEVPAGILPETGRSHSGELLLGSLLLGSGIAATRVASRRRTPLA